MVATLIVVENIYYQKPKEDAHHVKNVYQYPISSDEDPYGPRTYKISNERKPIDCGWIEECSLVHIVNKGDEGRSIYISETISGPPYDTVPPLCSTSIFPSTPQDVFVWADGDVWTGVLDEPGRCAAQGGLDWEGVFSHGFIFAGLMGAAIGPIISLYLVAYANGSAIVVQALGGTALIFLSLSCLHFGHSASIIVLIFSSFSTTATSSTFLPSSLSVRLSPDCLKPQLHVNSLPFGIIKLLHFGQNIILH